MSECTREIMKIFLTLNDLAQAPDDISICWLVLIHFELEGGAEGENCDLIMTKKQGCCWIPII